MIHNEGYANDKDFYIILKNPSVFTDLGEPNIARITIIDNDGKDRKFNQGDFDWLKQHWGKFYFSSDWFKRLRPLHTTN